MVRVVGAHGGIAIPRGDEELEQRSDRGLRERILGDAHLGEAIYPVVLAVLGHRLAGDDLLIANMAIAAVWGAGGLVGPALVGAAMQLGGPGGLPVSLALVWGGLVLFLVRRPRRYSSVRTSQSSGKNVVSSTRRR